MNQGTKQRIVGTVVLMALALIFLPIIFDGEGSYQRPLSSRIPEPPVIRIMPDPLPERPVIQADTATTVRTQPTAQVVDTSPDLEPISELVNTAAVASAVTEIDSTSEPATPSVSPALDEASLPFGWSVRLGSFSNTANAQNLKQRLLASGYRVYTRELNTVQGMLTAVFVGPQVERDLADRLKEQLQVEYQLSGIVVRFEVDSI